MAKDPSNVKQATYPIQGPLARILATVMRKEEMTDGSEMDIEKHETAFRQIIGNSFEAMDSMYFATPAPVRKHPAFSHRFCLRVATDPEKQTISITDLGSGMTRADLINSLGIGRLSTRAHAASKRLRKLGSGSDGGSMEDDEDDEDDEEEEEEEEEEDQNEEEEEEEGPVPMETSDVAEDDEEIDEADDEDVDDPEENPGKQTRIPCREQDIGGFYSALCALGVGVNVGTKSKFDEYYEFEVGKSLRNPLESYEYDSFRIVRPMDEGVKPTAATGFGRFEDVRGESGTRVTFLANQSAVEAGLLQEDRLRPILTKIFETSQYTIAFSSDPDANDIIGASATESQATESQTTADLEEAEPQEAPEDTSTGNGYHQAGLLNGARPRSHNSVKERAKYIPIRLSLRERKLLRLIEAAMTCSDYTTEVDRPFKSSVRRTHGQLKGITSILRGVVTAYDYDAGQRLLRYDNFGDYAELYCQVFEIARRHKIMNPEKMRTEYGKLVYLLQDAVSPSVHQHLSFSCKGEIYTVYKFLEARHGLALLDDRLIEVATQEILAGRKTRAKIAAEIKAKERAVANLKVKYRTATLSSEDIHLCLYSICDNNSFLNSNRVPIDKIIAFLKKYFQPDKIEEGYSLSIVSGQDGARLSHSHERQYYFALQSLTLWRDIVDDMFRLWHMAEEDLLSDTVTYSLQDTGQGMQRVQQSPRTYKAMQQILVRVQAKVSQWIGSSVIHMGDHNVPNALSFIDKYTQVPRILGPIVACLENLERICEEDEGIDQMVQTGYGGIDKLRKDILHDFFTSAFDGSGADNFYDAGSCIDGRLTSAWNWCSQLPSKPFYLVFKLTGFIGFDGEFK